MEGESGDGVIGSGKLGSDAVEERKIQIKKKRWMREQEKTTDMHKNVW